MIKQKYTVHRFTEIAVDPLFDEFLEKKIVSADDELADNEDFVDGLILAVREFRKSKAEIEK